MSDAKMETYVVTAGCAEERVIHAWTVRAGSFAQALSRTIKDHEDSGGALLWVRVDRKKGGNHGGGH